MVRPRTHRLTVCVFLENKRNEILLFERTNTETSRGFFVACGGGLEMGEDVLTAAAREVHEELGVTVEREDLELVGLFDRPTPEPDEECRVAQFYFRTKKWQGTPRNNEPDKHGEPAWYALSRLPEKLHPLDKKVVERGFVTQLEVV